MDEAMKLAKELSEGPTVALSQIRQLYWESTDNTYEEQLNAERWAQRTAGRADDFVEGVSAFLGKRKAEFKGK
jgi:2-(1,2-epoxy-1,2-dihydrophenyl)acetyl-CoA isomerase